MCRLWIAVAIVLMIILIWSLPNIIFKLTHPTPVESLTSGYPSKVPQSYIRLYEGFGQQKLAFEYKADTIGFTKRVVKIDLKSVDIFLPKWGTYYDQARRVEIWSLYGGENTSSLESDFYSTYLDPDYALTANDAKYRKVLTVLPGQHVQIDMVFPIKKILLYAMM